MESPSNESPLISWPGKRYEVHFLNCDTGFWFNDVTQRTGSVAFQITCRKCGYQWEQYYRRPPDDSR